MCKVCGCGTGETRIETGTGKAYHRHAGDATTDATGGYAFHLAPTRRDLLSQGQRHEHEHAHEHAHEHEHDHDTEAGDLHFGQGPAHAHVSGMSQQRMVRIEQDILAVNNAHAADNRRWFTEHGVFVLNLVSSPGAGKTSLLVRTIEALQGELPVAVVEGDQQTTRDADRIRATGAAALQINTGKGCHLDAHMLGHALERLAPSDDSLLLVENVGNLVCPAGFDLGEAHKVVVLSVTEGEDKPLKYPDMFNAADLMVLNKIDLLPHLRFDVAQCIAHAHQVNPKLEVLLVSAETGEGLDAWLDWLRAGVARARQQRVHTVDALQRRVAELEARLAARD